MKLTLRPSPNSKTKVGQYDMIDLIEVNVRASCMWGSVHVDAFWGQDNTAPLYQRLLHGEEVVVDITEATDE